MSTAKTKKAQPIQIPKYIAVGRQRGLTVLDEYGNTGTAVGIPGSTGNRILEILTFGETEEETLQNLQDIRKREQTEAATVKEAALQAARDREQAKKDAEPKPPSEVMPSEERCLLRRAPDIDEITLDCAGPSSLFTSAWLGRDERYFLDQLCREGELYQVGGTGISRVERYENLKENLNGFSTIDFNPRSVGDTPKRKWLLTKHNDFSLGARRINYLRGLELADLAMVVVTGAISLECLWFVEKLSTKKLAQFFRASVEMDSPWQMGTGEVMATMPAALAAFSTDNLLKAIGGGEKLPGKNHVIFFDPPCRAAK